MATPSCTVRFAASTTSSLTVGTHTHTPRRVRSDREREREREKEADESKPADFAIYISLRSQVVANLKSVLVVISVFAFRRTLRRLLVE